MEKNMTNNLFAITFLAQESSNNNQNIEAMRYVENLSIEKKNTLFELMRTSKSYKVRKRAHAILLSSKKYKIDQLASIFDVDRDTIADWLGRWEKDGVLGLQDATRPGRPASKDVRVEDFD